MSVSDSAYAKLQREYNQRDQTAKDNAAFAVVRGEEIERLKAELEKAREYVQQFRQAVIDTAPKTCPYPGRFVRPTGRQGDYFDPSICRGCSHTPWCKLHKETG